MLYTYRTAQHSSTGASPFQLMFGRPSQSSPFCQPTDFDPNTYSAQLQTKLASLQEFVHTNISASAQQQKIHYDKHSHVHSFVAGAPNGQVTKVVHVNRLRHRKQPQHISAPVTDIPSNIWFHLKLITILFQISYAVTHSISDAHLTDCSCKAWEKLLKNGAYVM